MPAISLSPLPAIPGLCKNSPSVLFFFIMLNICLFEPEIPQNTGNIARTCAVTGARLHLVRPLGFDISEKAVRHAGLDYWNDVEIIVHESVEAFMKSHGDDRLYFFSTKGMRTYSDEIFPKDEDAYLIFGKESRGIDEDILSRHPETTLRIPMRDDERSLNLSNSVAIAAYEYYRQLGFPCMRKKGELTTRKWEEL